MALFLIYDFWFISFIADNLMTSNPTFIKSLDYAERVVNLYKYLTEQKGEFVMSKQLLRSGTSIGANISEALSAESSADFIHKLAIAQKEANETLYWLMLLHRTQYITIVEAESMKNDCMELRKIITSIILTTKQKQQS